MHFDDEFSRFLKHLFKSIKQMLITIVVRRFIAFLSWCLCVIRIGHRVWLVDGLVMVLHA